MRIALATTPGSELISQDDRILGAALANLSAEVANPVWNDPDVDWGAFDQVVIRTTWDYHQRLEEFLAWMERVSQVSRVVNDPVLTPWNAHKSYLGELQSKGVPVVPTHFLGSKSDVDTFLPAGSGSEVRDWIVKPEVGACAEGIVRTAGMAASEIRDLLLHRVKSSKVLVQPFLSGVLTEGEVALVWIVDRVVHAIQKTPAPGDFRVQIDHGGSNRRVEIPQDALSVAHACISVLPASPTFARIDVIQDPQREWRLMEIELIEPELMFEWAPESADILAAELLSLS